MIEHSRHYHGILRCLPSPVIIVEDNAVAFINTTGKDLLMEFGLDPDIRSILDFFSLNSSYKQVISNQKASLKKQTKISLPSGTEQYFEVSVVQRIIDNFPVVILQFQNTTQLVQAEKMRSDFVANVSHELRTPLTSILGVSEILLDGTLQDTEVAKNFMQTMYKESLRMKRVLDDLLALSRIEQVEHIAPTETVKISEIISIVLDSLPVESDIYDIHIDDQFQGTATVLGLSDGLIQLFQNLIVNAVKYSPEGSRITIRIYADTVHSKNAVAIQVIDQGEGIAPEHINRLTERFYRVDKARSHAVGGTGLGLAIVKHIIGQHRGDLHIASTLNKGSTFTVILPLNRE